MSETDDLKHRLNSLTPYNSGYAEIGHEAASCIAALEAEVAEVKRQRNNAENALDAALADAKRLREELAKRENDLGIVLSALRLHEDAVGESFDDDGGDVASIAREHEQRAAHSDAGPPAAPPIAEAAPEGWRTMETAPRNSEPILLLTRTHGVTEARFLPGEWSEHPEYGREYSGALWLCGDDAWQIEVEEGPDNDYHDDETIGWLPCTALPVPPANGGERAEKTNGDQT